MPYSGKPNRTGKRGYTGRPTTPPAPRRDEWGEQLPKEQRTYRIRETFWGNVTRPISQNRSDSRAKITRKIAWKGTSTRMRRRQRTPGGWKSPPKRFRIEDA